jgi:uncharacterized protein (DUF488 family)
MKLFTIGFTQKSLRQFIWLLREAGVDAVVDIRRNNMSQLAGFAKRDDLAFILETCGIGYVEEKRLAPSTDLLDRYHHDHDWDAYEPVYRAELAAQDPGAILAGLEARFERPCLLCAEAEPDHCHRRLAAEAFATLRPSLEVRHLALARPGGAKRARGTRRAPQSRKEAAP